MHELEIIKDLILDSQKEILVAGMPRRLQIQVVPKKATICIGVRRCGKSTYMQQIMTATLATGVARENILHVNFFDDRLRFLHAMGPSMVIDAYYSLYPEKKYVEKIYCFFDEIQVTANWESFIDRIMRTEKCDVYITGSSAQMLAIEIATEMRGRSLSWEMFPFSFLEYLDFKNISVGKNLDTKTKLIIQKVFKAYWDEGGFPETIGLEPALRIKIHQEYANTLIFKDIVQRHDIQHPNAVLDLAHQLVENTAALYSVNSLTKYLRSLGHKISKDLVMNYVTWLEDAYFLFSVGIFDASIARNKRNPKKIYCIDNALAKSISSGILLNTGHMLENLVFLVLRRTYKKIYYYKTNSGKEVDFVVQAQDRSKLLYQVSESIADKDTRQRELSGLQEAMLELNVKHGMVITQYDAEEFNNEAGNIKVVPMWKFMLEHHSH